MKGFKLRLSISDLLIYLIIGTLYVYSISYSVIAELQVKFSPEYLMGATILALIFLAVIFYNIYTALLTMSGLALYALYWYPSIREYYYGGRNEFYALATKAQSIILYLRRFIPYDEEFLRPIILTTVIGISIITAAFLYKRLSFIPLALFGFGCFAINRTIGVVRSDSAFLIFIISFFLIFVVKLNLMSVDKNDGTPERHRAAELLGLPFIALLVIASTYLPVPGGSETPAYSDIQRNIYSIGNRLATVLDPQFFSFKSSGLKANNGKLGGPIRINNMVVMKVKSDDRVYLSAYYYDNYTGYSWENTGADYTETDKLNFDDGIQTVKNLSDPVLMKMNSERSRTGELVYSAEVVDPDDGSLLGEENIFQYHIIQYYAGEVALKTAEIDMGVARTDTVYHPLKTIAIDQIEGVKFMQNENSAIITSELMKENTAYTVKYATTDDDRAFAPETILQLLEVARNDENIDKMERYLQLPEDLPPRVKQMAEEITAGSKTRYSTVTAIESALKNMPYTLEPDVVPEGRDFVDYFLYDGKEGYCTYFASAMTVLCRSLGIPARYVEGYVMPPNKASDGNYYVSNKNAHAWVDVYFEGYGWMGFEPTPIYMRNEDGLASLNDEIVTSSTEVEGEDLRGLLGDLGYENEHITWNEPEAETESIENTVEVSEEDSNSAVFKTVAGFFVMLGVLLLLGLLKDKLFLIKIRKQSNAGQIRLYFKQILKMANVLNAKISAETPLQYAERLRGESFLSGIDMETVTETAYKAEYSNETISGEEVLFIAEGYNKLRQIMKESHGLPKYLLFHYVLWRY